jgi:SAM-dependent methyltransferase
MKITASQAEIAAATAYENLHVPALFRQWAPHVVKAAQIHAGDRVLDIACGTGVLAREAASLLGDDGLVSGVDATPGMLAVASQLAPKIDWREGVAESLPYESESFDAVISQFGLMFFQDRAEALGEMIRVLAPAGRIAFAVWESLENSEAYPIEVNLLEKIAGQPAADALRAPFVLGDRAELIRLFEDAGVASVEVATHHGTARFPSIKTMVEADLRGWLPVMGITLTEQQIERILDEAEQALSRYVTADGSVEFVSPAHIVTGTKPKPEGRDAA